MLSPPALAFAALLQVFPASPLSAPRVPTPIRLWLVTTPVPADTGATRLTRDYLGGERTAFPDSDAAWRPLSAGEDGLVDLGAVAHRPTDNVVSYAFSYVAMPRDETALLVVASRDDLAAWLNGQPVYAHRGGAERDTVIVRLAAGWNALLLKIVNRAGSYGFGAWLVAGRGRVANANHRPAAATGFVLPTATVTAGPITVTAPPVWRGSSLDVRGTLALTAWGPAPIAAATVQLISAGDTLIRTVVQSLVPGAARELRLEMNLADLADAAAAPEPPELQVLWRTSGQAAEQGTPRGTSLPVLSADRIIAALSGRLDLDWSDEQAVVQIPRVLAGLALDLVNGRSTRSVCAPGRCLPGDSLTIRLDARPATAAYIRVHDRTYTDIARNVALLPLLGDSVSVPPPSPDARAWLAAMVRADKTAYRRLDARYDTLFATHRMRWTRDTIDFVGAGSALPTSDLGLWWSDPNPSGLGMESLVRQGLYRQLSFQRRLGRRAQVVWGDPRATAYPRTLPQIWRGLGINAFVAQGLPEAGFFWEGIDGSRIFAYRLRHTDGSGEDLARQMAQSSHRVMVTYTVSESLERRDELRRLPAFPVLRDATPEDALRGVRGARPDAAWPVWRGDIAPVDAGAPAPAAAVDENLLLTAETLAALDAAPYPRAELRRAWEGAQARDAGYTATATALRDAAFRTLAGALDTRDGGGVPVVVFNPDARVRTSYATVGPDAAPVVVRGERTLRAVDAARRATPAVLLDDSLRFLAREVPPLGFKVFWIRQGTAPGGDTLVNDGLRPLFAATEAPHDGPAGHSWSFASVDAENVYVTALKRAEQTNAYVLRLVEWQGRPARVTVSFGRPVTRVRLANLLEDPAAGVSLARDRRSVTLTLRPREIATLLVDQDR